MVISKKVNKWLNWYSDILEIKINQARDNHDYEFMQDIIDTNNEIIGYLSDHGIYFKRHTAKP